MLTNLHQQCEIFAGVPVDDTDAIFPSLLKVAFLTIEGEIAMIPFEVSTCKLGLVLVVGEITTPSSDIAAAVFNAAGLMKTVARLFDLADAPSTTTVGDTAATTGDTEDTR
jgi:hypothetical protein